MLFSWCGRLIVKPVSFMLFVNVCIFLELSQNDPSQLEWLSVEYVYFVLISDKELSPKELLDLLQLSKWN